MYYRTSGLAFIVALCATHLCRAQESESLKNQFLEKAPKAWEEYRTWAKRLQGSCAWMSKYDSAGRRGAARMRQDFKQRPGYILMLEEHVNKESGTPESGVVRSLNPRYGFEIRRKTHDAPWVLSQYDAHLKFDGVRAPSTAIETLSTSPVGLATLGVNVNSPSLAPGFKLLRLSPEVKDNATLVKMEFELNPKDRLGTWLRGGWVLYDPDHHWVERECLLFMERPIKSPDNIVKGTHSAVWEYASSSNGFPLLKSIVARFTFPGFSNEETYEFRLREDVPPESAFTLTAFGLPEPAGMPAVEPRSGLWLWLAGAGLLCVAVAGTAMHRIRNSKTEKAPV